MSWLKTRGRDGEGVDVRVERGDTEVAGCGGFARELGPRLGRRCDHRGVGNDCTGGVSHRTLDFAFTGELGAGGGAKAG